MISLSLDTPDIAARLEALPPAVLHGLPFGVIHLDESGTVDFFSDTESQQSGLPAPQAIGKDFYDIVAPCMGKADFRSVLARAHGERVDVELGHTGDFSDPNRFFRVRIVSSERGGIWQLHDRT